MDLTSISSVLAIRPAVWDKLYHAALVVESVQEDPMKNILAVPWLLGLQHAVDSADNRTCKKFHHSVQMVVYQTQAFYAAARKLSLFKPLIGVEGLGSVEAWKTLRAAMMPVEDQTDASLLQRYHLSLAVLHISLLEIWNLTRSRLWLQT